MLNFKFMSKKFFSLKRVKGVMKNTKSITTKVSLVKPKVVIPRCLSISQFSMISSMSSMTSMVNSKSYSTSNNSAEKEKEEFAEEFKKYEEMIKEAENISKDLLNSLKTLEEGKLVEDMQRMNRLPIRFGHLEEVKKAVIAALDKIPLTKPSSAIEFVHFVDKLDFENFEQNFPQVDKKVRNYILSEKFSLQELSVLIYAYSKYQLADKSIWKAFYSQINGKIINLTLENTTQMMLAFTMIQSLSSHKNEDLLTAEEYQNLYRQLVQNVERKIDDLTFLDTFRFCISMTKRPVGIVEVTEKVWRALQNNFKKDISTFDLYQMSQIMLLFCETPYLDNEVFSVVEKELTKEYLEKVDEMLKLQNFNLQSFTEDLSKISFAYSLTRQGSQYYWSLVLKTFLKLKGNLSVIALENLLFITYRLIDYFPQTLNINQSDETMKNLFALFSHIEERIVKEKLLEEKKIDSFNTMMPLARIGNINHKIWNAIVKNIESVLSKTKQVNPFLLNDIIFAYANYYMNLIIARDESNSKSEDIANSYYLQNFQKIWAKIEDLVINLDEKMLAVPHLANMVIDLSQIDLDLTKAWAFLSENVIYRLEEFDVNNFVMVLMGFSKQEVQNKQLWKKFEEYVTAHIKDFSIEDMRKIVISFLKHKELNRDFWKLIEDKFSQKEILDKITLEYFIDLQISFAISNITNDKIWNKFEEIVFKNLKLFETDKDYLMNTVYSFSRISKGSPILWAKLAGLVTKDINGYDIDDLGHVAVCFKSDFINNKQLGTVLNASFWDNFSKNIEQKLPNAKLNSLNNLIRGVKENEHLNKNEKLVKKIENKINELLKDIPK